MVRTRAERAAQRARRKSDGLFPRMGQAQEQARAPVAPFSKEPAQERTRAARAARRARRNYADSFPGEGQAQEQARTPVARTARGGSGRFGSGASHPRSQSSQSSQSSSRNSGMFGSGASHPRARLWQGNGGLPVYLCPRPASCCACRRNRPAPSTVARASSGGLPCNGRR